MNDQITVRGHVATEPKHHRTTSGLDITSFRLAAQQRRYDPKQGAWVAHDTNWYTVSAFRTLATAAAGSLVKGQRIMVIGRLRVREWEQGERRGTSVDIEADGIGSDIAWQTKAPADDGAGGGSDSTERRAEPSVTGADTRSSPTWEQAPPQETPF